MVEAGGECFAYIFYCFLGFKKTEYANFYSFILAMVKKFVSDDFLLLELWNL